IALNVSVGDMPSGPVSLVSLWICCLIPATRISKNSSRLLLKIVMNLTRSISGCVGSCASSRTRRLNSSQLSSRLMKLAGSEKSRCGWIASGRRTSSSVLTSAAEVCIWSWRLPDSPNQRRTFPQADAGLCRCGDLLMANIFGGSGVNRIFGDVGGVIAHAFEVTGDEHQVDVAVQMFRMTPHAFD